MRTMFEHLIGGVDALCYIDRDYMIAIWTTSRQCLCVCYACVLFMLLDVRRASAVTRGCVKCKRMWVKCGKGEKTGPAAMSDLSFFHMAGYVSGTASCGHMVKAGLRGHERDIFFFVRQLT